MTPRLLPVLLVVPLVFAGCITDPPAAADAASSDSEPPERLDAPTRVAERFSTGFITATCDSVHGVDRVRGGFVLAGTDRLVITVASQRATGIQAGYALDGGEWTWLDPVRATETRSFDVPVEAEATEVRTENVAKLRWSFAFRLTSPTDGPTECRGTSAGYTLTVDAVPP